VTHLRAAGIDPADLADVAGDSLETATTRYTYALRGSHDQIRRGDRVTLGSHLGRMGAIWRSKAVV
jgi:hypothetical protein